MDDWRLVLKNSLTKVAHLDPTLQADTRELDAVTAVYPMRINSYYLELIRASGAPLARQAIPDLRELDDPVGMEDPLAEENLSPIPNLVHKYPDRVLFLVCSQCAVYCRFCTRKRKVGTGAMRITDQTISTGLQYLRETPSVREVLLSGGDPLLLDNDRLEWILSSLHRIPSIEVIRIGTRVPCTLPMRITPQLAAMLRQFHPLYINTHFNHPAELTEEARRACGLLADAGIPLGCQTVLLRGVNDEAATMRRLMLGLLQMRVKPYYLFQADLTRGTNHFRTSLESGLTIMRQLIGHISGLAVPTYAVDAPGGGGKIPLTPEYILSRDKTLEFINYQGKKYCYPDIG